ncbi:MAG TPA: class I SAM-dependent methyltransferase [Solirubrobacterales bacterium]
MARYVPALRFRPLTRIYDPVVRATTREAEFKRRLLDQARIEPGHRVLDLACGTGTLAIDAKRRAPRAELAGIDGDPEMLERARAKAEAAGVEVRFDEGLSTALPYEDSTFDRVLSTLFFHHLDRAGKRATIAEVARVLRPGGGLHVADWGKASDPLMGALSWPVRLLDGLEVTRENFDGSLPAVLARGGLEDVAERDRMRTPLGSMVLLSARA